MCFHHRMKIHIARITTIMSINFASSHSAFSVFSWITCSTFNFSKTNKPMIRGTKDVSNDHTTPRANEQRIAREWRFMYNFHINISLSKNKKWRVFRYFRLHVRLWLAEGSRSKWPVKHKWTKFVLLTTLFQEKTDYNSIIFYKCKKWVALRLDYICLNLFKNNQRIQSQKYLYWFIHNNNITNLCIVISQGELIFYICFVIMKQML